MNVIIGALLFSAGFFIGRDYPTSFAVSELTFDKATRAYQILQESFIFKDNIDREKLEYGAAKGLVEAVGDPYTYFLSPEETKEFFDMINGSFEGIGAEIGLNAERQVTIIAPVEGTPAKKAGLQPQDVVLQIDERLTSTMTLDEAVTFIRGKKGTSVTLTIKREGLPEPLKISIVRDVIKIPTLSWKSLEGGSIAYIQLHNFHDKAGDQFDEAARKILGTNAKKIILDLRGNPGGILQEAVSVAGWFTGEDAVIATERFANGSKEDYISEGPGKLKGFPLVILVDKGSASASEILAGALRFHSKAQLVGEKTFGKGTVQIIQDLPDGSSLRVTQSQWLLPDGSSIDHEGLSPDALVATKGPNATQDEQLAKAIELLNK